MDDRQIIELYNERSETAISETADKYGKYCYFIAYHILYNEQDSEECVNDTWLRTWNSIPPARPDSLKYYVGMITRHLSLNRFEHLHRAKRGGAEVILALDEIAEVADPEANTFTQLDEQEFARILNAFLRELPERDCSIFIRRYYYVQGADEIARYYRITRANVFKILSRARAKLRQVLEKEGYTV